MTTVLYGYSDDLIELEGDIREEFNPVGDDGDLIVFSTGTVLRIEYGTGGVWRITHVAGPTVPIEQCAEDDEDVYSDRATIEGATWAVHGIAFARSK